MLEYREVKTTLDIPDATFRKAKTLMAAEGITLKLMVADALVSS